MVTNKKKMQVMLQQLIYQSLLKTLYNLFPLSVVLRWKSSNFFLLNSYAQKAFIETEFPQNVETKDTQLIHQGYA